MGPSLNCSGAAGKWVEAAHDVQRSPLSASCSSTQTQTLPGCTGLCGTPEEMLGKSMERGGDRGS